MNPSTHTPRSFIHTLPELRCEWSAVIARHGQQAAQEALAKARLLPGAPMSLGIGLTTACNFSCPICYYHGSACNVSEKSCPEMPLATLKHILQRIGALEQVVFATEGEPFLYSGIWDALDLAANAAKSIVLASNGSLISTKEALRLQKYPIKTVFLSIDGADGPTYEKFRKGGIFRKFTRATSLLTESLGQRVIFHAVLCAQNCTSLLKLPRLARQLGVQNISLAQIRMHPGAKDRGVTPCSSVALWDFLDNFLAEAQHNGIGVFFDSHFADAHTMQRLRLLLGATKDTRASELTACPSLWQHATITQDCSLFPCCGDFQPVKILHEDFNFETVFNHEYLILLRAMMLLGTVPGGCAACLHRS